VEIGAHVKTSGGLLTALGRGEALGCEVIQIFTQNPRRWRPSSYDAEALAAYRTAQAQHPSISSTFSHATYLINLATSNDELLKQSRQCLIDNLASATIMGAKGVILHVGSHRGTGLAAVQGQIVDALVTALDEAATLAGEPCCALLLENAAGAGGTVGRSFEELAVLLELADDSRLGVCLDTQHLFASGVSFASLEEADAAVTAVESTVRLSRVGCIHLNDSKVPFGANRDRHENLGEGAVGSEALACLLGHPHLQAIPAILEVPGDGEGPRAKDVAAARELLALGRALREQPR
jgi:deoxyribonuclease-4